MRKISLLTGLLFILAVSSALAQDERTADSKPDAESKQEASQKDVGEKEKKASDKSKDGNDKEDQDEEMRVGVIKLSGAIPEGKSVASPFGTDDGNLRGLIKRLRKAAKDKNIDAVLLRLRNPSIGRGTVHEICTAIQEFKESGKKIWAEIEFATTTDYLIASSCDKILMPESGFMLLPGTRAEIMFYRNLFDKLQIEPDWLQMGDFKGASEPFMREKLSPEFRKQLDTVLGDFHEQMVQRIAESRDLSTSDVQAVVDKALLMANDALDAGLIDMVGYEQDLHQALLGDSDKELELVDKYAKKQVDTDFSGMSGLVKMMELFSGAKSTKRKSKKQKVAVVYATGVIMTGSSATSLFGGTTMGSDTIVKALEEADEDDKVAAIVLRVNSPGGSALASDLIWNKIEQIEKPVVCSMGDVAASGGYYISMGCDRILAEPNTLTGSIGVVSGKLALGKMMERFGLTTDVISYGKNSGLFSANDPFSESERTAMRRLMEVTYEQFTTKAAGGRKMELDELKSLAEGRVWTGRQAFENGLVDELGTLDDAIKAAQKLAGMETDQRPELRELPEPKSFFEQLIEGGSVSAPELIGPQTVRHLPSEVQFRLQQLETLQHLQKERCWLLSTVQIRD